MTTSAIVLAGGLSRRLGKDKGLLQLAGEPLVKHVLSRINNLADEKIVVVGSAQQIDGYIKVAGKDTLVIVDNVAGHGPLGGATTGFERAKGEYSFLLPCDTPFLSKDVLSLLLDLCASRNACIPRWPNGYVEPLHAVYRTKPAQEACILALHAGENTFKAMLENLGCLRYVSTLVLEQLGSGLETFLNINTPLDLKKAERLLSRSS